MVGSVGVGWLCPGLGGGRQHGTGWKQPLLHPSLLFGGAGPATGTVGVQARLGCACVRGVCWDGEHDCRVMRVVVACVPKRKEGVTVVLPP